MTKRIPLTLFLVLSLGLSTIGFGVARGQAPVAGEQVICTGLGAVTVAVDAGGNPVRSHGLCPDNAALFFAALLPVAPDAMGLSGEMVGRDWPADEIVGRAARPGLRWPRAPPA